MMLAFLTIDDWAVERKGEKFDIYDHDDFNTERS